MEEIPAAFGVTIGAEVPFRIPFSLTETQTDRSVKLQVVPSIRLLAFEDDTPWMLGLGIGVVTSTNPENQALPRSKEPDTKQREGASVGSNADKKAPEQGKSESGGADPTAPSSKPAPQDPQGAPNPNPNGTDTAPNSAGEPGAATPETSRPEPTEDGG